MSEEMLDVGQAKRLLEALLYVSGQLVAAKRIKEVVPECDAAQIRKLVEELNAEYAQHQHAFRIQEIAGAYQLVTDPDLAPALKQRLQMPRPDWLSKAAMETIAIIAYRQPLTKAEVEAVRGVDVTGTLETLVERQFVRVTGRKDTPGRPLLYGTTNEFLHHFGMKSIAELPPLPSGSMPALPGMGAEGEPAAAATTH